MVEMSATVSPALAQSGAVLAATAVAQKGDGAPTRDFSTLLAGAALAAQPPAAATETLAQSDVPTPALPDFVGTLPAQTSKQDTSGKPAGKILPPGKLPAARELAAFAKATRREDDDAAAPGEDLSNNAPVSQDLAPAVPIVSQMQATTPSDVMTAASLVNAALPQQVAPRSETSNMASKPAELAIRVRTDESVRGQAGLPAMSRDSARNVSLAIDAAPSTLVRESPAVTSVAANAPQPVHLAHTPTMSRSSTPAVDPATNTAPIALVTGGPMAITVAAALVHVDPAVEQGGANVVTTRGSDADRPTVLNVAVPPTTATVVGASPRVTVLTAALSSAAASIMTAQGTSIPSSLPDAPLSTATLSMTTPAPQANQVGVAPPNLTVAVALLSQPAAIVVAVPPASPAPAAPSVLGGVDLAPLSLADAPIAATPPASQAGLAAATVQSVAPYLDAANPVPSAIVPALKSATHKTTATTQVAAEAPVTLSGSDALVAAMPTDLRSAPVIAPTTTPSAAATPPTQDIAALVDRITEARAAAAPHAIRAALVHEDFGSVSLNFRSEASHIHVTLGSADPGFAPAVQAAAAASLAGQSAGDDGSARRDAPAPQPSPQQQDAATRNDASPQQQAPRDRATERQTARETAARQARNTTDERATASTPQRRGGIYA
jgi:hypothetical protein